MSSRTSHTQLSQLRARLHQTPWVGWYRSAAQRVYYGSMSLAKDMMGSLEYLASLTYGVMCDLCLSNQILKDKNLHICICAIVPLPPGG